MERFWVSRHRDTNETFQLQSLAAVLFLFNFGSRLRSYSDPWPLDLDPSFGNEKQFHVPEVSPELRFTKPHPTMLSIKRAARRRHNNSIARQPTRSITGISPKFRL